MISYLLPPEIWLMIAFVLAGYIIYRIVRVFRTEKLKTSDAISLLGIVVTLYLASVSITESGISVSSMDQAGNIDVTKWFHSETSSASATTVPTATSVPADSDSPQSTDTEVTVDTMHATVMSTTMTVPSQTSTSTPKLTLQSTNTPSPLLADTNPAAAISTPIPAHMQIVAPLNSSEDARITAQGLGSAPDNITQPAQRSRAALLAAELDAKRKLAEWIDGAEIKAITVIEQGTLTTDVIRQVVAAKIPVPTVVDQSYDTEANIAKITLEIIVKDVSN